MLRIAHVIPSLAPSFGGPSFVAIGMTRALARRGHHVTLLTTRRGGETPAGEVARDGVNYMVFDEIFQPYAYSPALAKALTGLAPQLDLLHIHSLYLHPTVAAGRAAQRHRVPYILCPHGALDPFHLARKRVKKAVFDALIHNRILRRAAAFHFTTDGEAEISQPHTFDRPSIIVPNGLDISEFGRAVKPNSFRSRFPEIGNRLIVLYLGRVNYKKGFEVLIPAFANLIKHRGDVHLVIAGNDDGYLGTVRRLVSEFGLADVVTFTGFLQGQDKIEAFAESAIFVLPSYSENFAIAVFEALAAGVPVIVSNRVNSWPEIATAGVGIVIDPNVSALQNAMESLLTDAVRRASMAQRAIAFVKANYGWESVALKLEIAYLSVLERPATGGA